MSDIPPQVYAAINRAVGKNCPHCDQLISSGDQVLDCPSCLSPQHSECWSKNKTCGSYFCRRETNRDLGEADIVISREETSTLREPAPALPSRPPPAPLPTRTDPYATASLVLGIVSVPVIGCLVGPAAVLIGAISLGRIGASGELRGKGRAITGFLLGIVGTVLWIGGGFVFQHWNKGPGFKAPFLTAAEAPRPPLPETLASAPAAIRHALKANVFIEGSAGLSRWIGAGIVVRASSTHIRVLTNRHVAEGDSSSNPSLVIQTVLGHRVPAIILWRSPNNDLALIEAAFPNADQQVSVAKAADQSALPPIGSKVFAIGNPHSLSWTYTEGAVSSHRQHQQGQQLVTLIQTQTPINPGNSGGGLYNADGFLVGVNTWKIKEEIGEGLGFAIAIPSVLELRPDLLGIRRPGESVEDEEGGGE